MKANKILVFLVLAVFLISAVSLALAREENAGEDNKSTRDNAEGGMRAAVAGFGGLKARIVEKFMEKHPVIVEKFLEYFNATNRSNIINNLDRARLQKCLNNTDECKEKIMNWTVHQVQVKNLLRKREIAEDKLNKAEEKFLEAKNKYEEMKNVQLRVRDEFLGLKLDLKKCKSQSQNCSELENKTFEKAQEDLSAITDKLIQYLEKVKSRVESAENMNATEANDTIANIDALIARLDDAKTKVESATTQDELKEAADLIRDVWNDMKYKAFLYAERVIHARVGEIFVRSELLEKKLDVVVQKLKDKGINTSEIDAQLDNFSAKVDDARTKMTEANKLFAEAKDLRAANNTDGAKAKLEEAKNLTTQAHQDLKEAHTILMDLVHMINQKGESFNPDELNDDEEVEVVSEEDD